MGFNIKTSIVVLFYTIGTGLSLLIALLPFTLFLYYILVKSQNLLLFVTLPLTISFFWLLGFFIFVIVHSKLVVPLLLPTVKVGEYPINSSLARRYFLRLSADNIAKYWVKTLEWIPFLAQLHLYSFMLKQYGVRIGKRVYIATETRIDALPLVEIGDDTFIAPRAVIGVHINHHGTNILFKPVKIGKKCFIGQNSVVTPGAILEDGAILGAYSVIKLNTRIPASEVWAGLPAKPLKKSRVQRNNSFGSNETL